MKESKLFGILLPFFPDFIPINDTISGKYYQSEKSPRNFPIIEIYLA
jgi:hypothetical protein